MVLGRKRECKEAYGAVDGKGAHLRVEIVVKNRDWNGGRCIDEEGQRCDGGKTGGNWGMKLLPRGRVHIENDEGEVEKRRRKTFVN